MDAEVRLLAAMERLIRLQQEISSAILSECGVPDITGKQIEYLKVIDEQGDMTFTRLAEITRNSKPTVTEMINRCTSMACVYRERSPDDGRTQFIRLTEKGRTIARAERIALVRMIERMVASLEDREIDRLVELLAKVR